MLFWESIRVSILTVSIFTSVNIQKARLCYSNECNLLKKYAKTLDLRDEKIAKLIKTLVGNDNQFRMMTEQYIKEIKQSETRANQLWSRNEAFQFNSISQSTETK